MQGYNIKLGRDVCKSAFLSVISHPAVVRNSSTQAQSHAQRQTFHAHPNDMSLFALFADCNFNCVFLDCNTITIGDRVLMAPNVQLYTAGHPLDPAVRNGTSVRPNVLRGSCSTKPMFRPLRPLLVALSM